MIDFDGKSFQSLPSEAGKVLVDMASLENLMSTMMEKSLSKIVQATKEEVLKAQKSEDTEKKVVHFGVACSGCGEKKIVGIRYKCTVCLNFNYCEKCEMNCKHPHNFIKMKERDLFELFKPNQPKKIFPKKVSFFEKEKEEIPLLIHEAENDYFKALKEKAEKLQKCFPKEDFDILLAYVNGAPEDMTVEELVENFKH